MKNRTDKAILRFLGMGLGLIFLGGTIYLYFHSEFIGTGLIFSGLITGNSGFYGFFGAFGFFGALGGRGSDERVDTNINRACRDAFIFTTIALSSSMAYAGFFKTIEIFPLLLILPFAGSMLLFALSYTYFDKRGDVE